MSPVAPNPASVDRNANLDLLRASAIVMVVVYHVIQMSPVPLLGLMKWASGGQYGVDLFFVLSGWLIGGLYWRELAEFGDVDLKRFWLRRWLRTIPPYLVALLFSWLAVRLQRREPFDWGYLIFFQNFYARIPFFLVSWSLCIEEHFYVLVPLLLVFSFRRSGTLLMLFGSLVLAAPLCRWWASRAGVDSAFGFQQTATHLRMEGLLLGFWLARLQVLQPVGWLRVKRVAPWCLSVAVLVLIAVCFAGSAWMYRIGLTALALGWAALLVCLVGHLPGRIVSSRSVKAIALASYSIYLTHPLMIHVARKMIESLPAAPWVAYFPLVLALIAVAGGAFYFAVERTSIYLRDRWAPRRTAANRPGVLLPC